MPIITRNQCDEWLDNLTVSEGMVCAGYDDGGKDACQVSQHYKVLYSTYLNPLPPLGRLWRPIALSLSG